LPKISIRKKKKPTHPSTLEKIKLKNCFIFFSFLFVVDAIFCNLFIIYFCKVVVVVRIKFNTIPVSFFVYSLPQTPVLCVVACTNKISRKQQQHAYTFSEET
jgi:hypothetical protein